MSAVLVIAEAGVNHNGSMERAIALVDAAAAAGADMVKFQTFKADQLASASAKKADYQTRNTQYGSSQLDMLRALELSEDDHAALIARCAEKHITFLSTPFDPGSLDLLVHRFKMETIKLGSGELTNGPLLLQAAKSKRKLIVSTGMGNLDEIQEALGVLAFGFTSNGTPTRKAFAQAYESATGRAALQDRVTLLHCTTEYPAPLNDINLRAMDTLRDNFGLRVGFSDHSEGHAVAIAAVARGAEVIEKHFTLDRNLPGPDHKASIEPDELKAMISGIRAAELALGDGVKAPRGSEKANMAVARKVLVAARDIAAGQKISADDIKILRAGEGLSPMGYWEIVGSIAKQPVLSGEPLLP
jgi:N-acetylneuraminate synthase